MESPPPKKVYTLFLNTRNGFSQKISPVGVSGTNNVTWNVDWDALFNRDNYVYKTCNLRVSMASAIMSGTPSTAEGFGVLTANFGQNFTGKNVQSVVLGQLKPSIQYSYDSQALLYYVPFGVSLNVNTLDDALGQQIDMPYGLNQLTIQQWKIGFGLQITDALNVLLTNAPTYTILLQFELS